MNFLIHHKLIIIVGVVAVVALAWWGISGNDAPSSSSLLTTQSTYATVNADDQNLVATLLALRAVKLEGSIFADPAFIALTDFSTEIVPEPVGRADPFAPLSSGVSVGTSQAEVIFSPNR
ncbi:MAG: hypothetical protein NUV59_01370 [Patescibacteria group bacterium]|nr:hypothetical protein [Patescibacteria group bacterium]